MNVLKINLKQMVPVFCRGAIVGVVLPASLSMAESGSAESQILAVDTRSFSESPLIVVDTRPHYQIWASTNGLTGLNALPMAQPYADGVQNLLKYAFHIEAPAETRYFTSPWETGGLPTCELLDSGEQRSLRLHFLRRKNDPLINYIAEFSEELHSDTFIPVEIPLQVISLNEAWEHVVYVSPVSAIGAQRKFGRVRVNYNVP